MKLPKVILLLSVLLLCGILLHASNNNKKANKFKNGSGKEVPGIEAKKDMELVPNILFL